MVRMVRGLVRAGRNLRSGVAQSRGHSAGHRGSRHESGAAERDHHHTGITRAVGGDLARGRAADQRDVRRAAANASEQRGEVVRGGREDNNELAVLTTQCFPRGRGPGALGIREAGSAHSEPAGHGFRRQGSSIAAKNGSLDAMVL
jgi:hypothetical protein